MNVSAIIVTRGDVDLSPILESLPSEWEQIVWDNSEKKADAMVWGRYASLRCEVKTSHVFFQDDDVIIDDPRALAAAWEPGSVVCNMPERFRHDFYRDHALVGFGAFCEVDLPLKAFRRFWAHATQRGLKADLNPGGVVSDFFHRTCDIVFTTLTPRILVDVPYTDREFASAPNRMWKQPKHVGERQRMLELARKVRDA